MRMPMRAMVSVLLCICSTSLAGFASVPSRPDPAQITVDEILTGGPIGPPEDRSALIDSHDVLALSAEMRAFVDEHVGARSSNAMRLWQLNHAVIESGLKLEYDETTRTAAATFQAQRGNCLSFSAMFVAMARHAGLDAHFQEVDIPPDWSLRDDTLILNRHVNVLVDLGHQSGAGMRVGGMVRGTGSLVRDSADLDKDERIVDFNMSDFRASYDRRRISDARLLAHYDNNIAVERMQVGDVAAALGHFRRAIANDPSFSPPLTNLGILYMRNGHAAYAEAAHLLALEADPTDLVAMSNLAGLYERQGDRERAAAYHGRVIELRKKNPYYWFHLAQEAYRTGDFDAAIGHLKKALRRKRNEDRFYFLLAKNYLKKGDLRAARRWLARAEAVAATDVLKRRYASKMALLNGA